MPPRQWKNRLQDMKEAVDKVLAYCEGVNSEQEFAAKSKTIDACIRNFQVLGEAANKVPSTIRDEFREISWKQIRGMRNILVHEYFGVSPSILWATIQKDLPKLKMDIDRINQRLQSPAHPWRLCPPGETYVRKAKIAAYMTKGHLVREHLRRDHCREIEGSTKNTLTLHETEDMAEIFFSSLTGPPSSNDMETRQNETQYDHLIRGWTKYWNDIFQPDPPLDPDLVKALIASESDFKKDLGEGKKGIAKGLMQLLPLTMKALHGYRNELKDHLFEFSESEIYEPPLHIAAGIRWLFQERTKASRRLKRQATWEEAVENYKDYLKRRPKKKSNLPHPEMKRFFFLLGKLKNTTDLPERKK